MTVVCASFCGCALTTKDLKRASLPPESPLKNIPNWRPGNFAKVNGINLYYEIYGNGEPLLLLPGGSATIETFFNQIPDFSRKFQVIVPDYRGHGRTQDSSKPLSYELIASDLVELLHQLKLTRVSVVGWSDGAILGLHLAMHNPNLVKKLVVIGANFRADGMNKAFQEGVRQAGPNDHLPFLVDLYKQLSPDGPEHWPIIYGKLKTMWLTSPNYTTQQLKKIKSPTLLMVGDRDFVRPEHTQELFQSIPNAQLCVIPGASHFVAVEKPKLLNEIILSFLKG